MENASLSKNVSRLKLCLFPERHERDDGLFKSSITELKKQLSELDKNVVKTKRKYIHHVWKTVI